MDFPTVLVVDFGAQYAQLIARRIREAGVYSEIVSCEVPAEEIVARKPAAIILSGGPSSVYAPEAPQVDPTLFEAGVPAFGICYGFQAMAASLGGTVARTGAREYGGTPLTVTTQGRLFGALRGLQNQLRLSGPPFLAKLEGCQCRDAYLDTRMTEQGQCRRGVPAQGGSKRFHFR